MRPPIRLIQRLFADRRGATVVEYGLILAFIVLAIFGALQSFGGSTGELWNTFTAKIVNAS